MILGRLQIAVLFVTYNVGAIDAATYGRSGSKVCDKSKFACNSGECIPEEKLCDGTENCSDGSDETNDCVNIIPCSSHFLFQCDYGACIAKKFQCDGKNDCKDGSDESSASCNKCGSQKFKCGSGECIDEMFLCDGVADCNDGSDETRKECVNIACPLYSFRCTYGACIVKRFKCNGIYDCVDGSDEKACVPTSSSSPGRIGKFRCDSGEEIEDYNVCDGIGDCRDNSDETQTLCSSFTCPLYTYRCKYGACVKRNARCDGKVDCVDSSDEKGCEAPAASSPKPQCPKDQFRCTSGKCVKEESVCDGKKDCDDGSEETFDICAYRRCSSSSFTCSYGACVSRMTRCNGVIDCMDASDEHDCGSTTTQTRSGCVVPSNPEFGSYRVANLPLTPGQVAPPYSVLIPKCQSNYGVTPPEQSFSVCLGEEWMPPMQNCSRTCPQIESTSPIDCKFKNQQLKTCNNAVEGTIALIQCNSPTDGVAKSIVNFCRNGLWDSPVNQCIPNSSSNVNIFYIFNSDKGN